MVGGGGSGDGISHSDCGGGDNGLWVVGGGGKGGDCSSQRCEGT
jgi:hypothetical protein